MSQTHTRTRDGVLVDEVRESPVDRWLLRFRRRLWGRVARIVLLIVAVSGAG